MRSTFAGFRFPPDVIVLAVRQHIQPLHKTLSTVKKSTAKTPVAWALRN
jgi:hypothetical protein